jgi:Shikimate 5-dehydrogenase
MLRCGLLGEKLGHSYSPAIHALLGEYEYRLYEKAPDEVESFLRSGDFDGLNVTIPYKKTVLPLCADLSDEARAIGSVNTLFRRPDGTLFGDNTDAWGFRYLLSSAGIDPRGQKALVLGSGGASVMAVYVLKTLGASDVTVISRSGPDNYQNLDRHADAELIVNTTPVGMYPNNGAAAVDLTRFPRCRGVADVVYNPARTALLLQAEALGIPHAGGLGMLVGQALRASERFQGRALDTGLVGSITEKLRRESGNIILIGMPGCGKSTLAARLHELTGRPVFDADERVVSLAGKTIPEIFAGSGEAGFRALETQALAELGKLSGAILATGGGCVTREENYPLLHQNGTIFWLRRDTALLPREGRPLSENADLAAMYEQRAPLYARFADRIIDNDGAAEATARKILEAY